MRATLPPESARIPAKNWGRILARYRDPSPRRSVAEIAVTAIPLIAL